MEPYEKPDYGAAQVLRELFGLPEAGQTPNPVEEEKAEVLKKSQARSEKISAWAQILRRCMRDERNEREMKKMFVETLNEELGTKIDVCDIDIEPRVFDLESGQANQR